MMLIVLVAIVAGSLALGGLIFAAVYFGIKSANNARLADLEQQGIIARAGHGWITLVARDYRGPNMSAGSMIKKNPGELILTVAGLHAIGAGLGRGNNAIDLGPEDLKKCRAWLEGDWLHISTQSPPNATGEIELRTRLKNSSEKFLGLLRERGVAVEGQRSPQ